MTDEIERIADQLERAYGGDPWYGASLRDALAGLTPEAAARRVDAKLHTVWEIVLHITSWMREVERRLRDGVAREPEDGDWPAPPEPTALEWASTLDRLDRIYREALDTLRALPPGRLDQVLGDARDRPLGSGVSYYVMVHGLVQHTLAHTAQITLLRKALGA